MKMALVFRWYLGCSSRWAVQGDQNRKFDMQIWCGQAMGAFNLWVKGTALEKAENRHVGEVAKLLLNSCAYHYMKNMLILMGVSADLFTTFTIAGPTGEGLTSARSFTRYRRCVMSESFRII